MDVIGTADWATGEALKLVMALNAMRVGDEVMIDTRAWYEWHGWDIDGQHFQPTSLAYLGPPHFPNSGGWTVNLPTPSGRWSRGWNSAHEFIIAWRPKQHSQRAP